MAVFVSRNESSDRLLGRLDEVHIEVKQMEIMRQCYKDILGFEENFYHEGKMLGLITGGASLVLTASERRSSGVKLDSLVKSLCKPN